jgi:hypothetical protein
MSHVSTLSIQVSDVDAFEAACRECGVELLREQKTFKTYGGSRNPCDMAVVDVANPNAYEIGLVRNAAGKYEVKTDEWENDLQKKVGKNAGLLLQHYGIGAAKRVAIKQGMQVREHKLPDGRIRLVCEPRQQQATASAGGGWGGSGY